MGDPKKQRKQYKTPMHPWQKERIDYEKEILKEYGLKNKKEIWKMESVLRKFRSQAKKLVAQDTLQAKREEELLLNKLVRLNLIEPGAKLESILNLDLKDILNRRLQTQVLKQGLAKSTKQARQFITHRHIKIGDKRVNVPSYLISAEEEFKISFSDSSGLSKDDHPERIKKETEKLKEEVEKKTGKKKEGEVKKKKSIKKVSKKKTTKKEIKELKEEVKEEPKKEIKEESKKEIKEEKPKKEVKELKEEIKEEPKKEVKEESKKDVKEEKS